MKTNNIIGKRIIIRSYRNSDLEFLTNMWFDEENGKYMSDPTKEYVDEVYKKALDNLETTTDGYYLTVVLKENNEPVGSAVIFPAENNVFDIGYCVSKKYWQNGIGGEIVSLLIDRLKEMEATKINAEVARNNISSNKLLQKFGFYIEKESQFKKYNMDICFDSYIYAKNLN